MRCRNDWQILCLVLIVTMLCHLAWAKPRLDSYWRKADITVDGKNLEWQGTLGAIEKAALEIGLLNDDDSLYLSLSFPERRQMMRILMGGMVVWFEPEGGKKKKLGVRFPIGLRAMQEESVDREVSANQPPQGSPDREDINARLVEMLKLMEIILDGEKMRLPSREVPGIRAGVRAGESGLFYERKVPLRASQDYPYAIGVLPNRVVGLGLEAPQGGRSQGGNRPRGMGTGGGSMAGPGIDGDDGEDGMSGGGLNPGGLGGGRSGGTRRPPQMEGLKIWLEVNLASVDRVER